MVLNQESGDNFFLNGTKGKIYSSFEFVGKLTLAHNQNGDTELWQLTEPRRHMVFS
jgi:hypothetical protein